MTERERFICIIKQAEKEFSDTGKPVLDIEEYMADFLLENGVIVTPVKVGERRIDDLGRIHIPKDVRQSLNINYGDVISISVSDASIVLKKEREDK